jgi:hypothetical protein
MKKHRVIFINGPVRGQVHELNPHDTRIFVMHAAGPGEQPLVAVIRAEENIDVTVTDESMAITTYTISSLRGEKGCWYVAATGGSSCQDRLLGIILGKVTGEGYAIGCHENDAPLDAGLVGGVG